MGLRQRLQDVTSSGRNHPDKPNTEIFEAGVTAEDIVKQERLAANADGGSGSEPAGHQLVAPETVAPRTESEIQRHIEISPEIIMSLAREPVPPEHNKTAGLTSANTSAALREAFRILGGPEQLAVLTNIVLTQAAVVAKQAVSAEGLTATRLSAQEAFVGSYDAVEKKWQERYASIPEGARYIAFAGGAFVAFFIVGVFLAVWRFVLFGLN